jgi:ketopantoate hydroxymethyltransferase
LDGKESNCEKGYGQVNSFNEAKSLFNDARLLDELGVFSLVLEKIPGKLAKRITAAIAAPTIGIGAGVHCDGQILVVSDMLGLSELPRVANQDLSENTERRGNSSRALLRDT